MIEENLTPEQQQERVDQTVRAARDSVWVISDEIQKKAARNGVLTEEGKGNLERNVAHLELVMQDPKVVELGGDLSDLTTAITDGKAALVEE